MTKIRLCPKCKKPTLRSAVNVSGWLAPNMYECSDSKCGYVGYIYIEVDSKDFKFNEDNNSNKEE
jgi:hypothetical protein